MKKNEIMKTSPEDEVLVGEVFVRMDGEEYKTNLRIIHVDGSATLIDETGFTLVKWRMSQRGENAKHVSFDQYQPNVESP